jgi:hypothetical protein
MVRVTNLCEGKVRIILVLITVFYICAFFVLNDGSISAATPYPPDALYSVNNSTKGAATTKVFNTSGGYISVINLTANIQNTRWKAFVGNVSGTLTLQDATGSKVFGWTYTSFTGRVYATRNSSSPTWASINCSNITHLNTENIALEHSNVNDNLTITFNTTAGAIHGSFYSAGRLISNNTCPVLRTYVNSVSQTANFTEVALYDTINIIYGTMLENDAVGYDGKTYDFQMLVPENGNSTWASATAYYLYIEVD